VEFNVQNNFICLLESYKNLFSFTIQSATNTILEVTVLRSPGRHKFIFLVLPVVLDFRYVRVSNPDCLISINVLDPGKKLGYYFPLS
jgi:hypothetical protein